MSTTWLNIRIAVQTVDGWQYCSNFAAIGHSQRRILSALARSAVDGKVPRGTPSRIAESLGLHRESIWTQLRIMRRKFGVRSNDELAKVGKKLSRTRERDSSNRAFQFAPVSDACECGRDAATQAEALHPGAAPSRAL